MYMMKKQSDWASYGMMEEPFWRNDMTPEEFELERAYLVNIYSRGIKAKINSSQDFMEIVELAGKIAHMTDDELEKIIIDV